MHPQIHAEEAAGKNALVFTATGDSISYAELERRANRFAHGLRSLGMASGDTIAIVCDNRPEYLDLYWAAQRAGLVLVPVSSRLKPDEIAYIVNDSAAKTVVVGDTLAATARGLRAIEAQMPGLAALVTLGPVEGFRDLAEIAAHLPGTRIADEGAGGRMTYSSGTTGRPKGIRFPPPGGSPIVPNPAAQMFSRYYGFNRETVYLSPAPLYHSAPLAATTGVQALGGCVVLMPKFEPEAFLAAIERHHVTAVQVVPTMFIRLLALPEEVRTRYDLSSLKTVIHAAAPCPVPVKQAMIDWLGPILMEFYAGSEGNGHVRITSEEWLRKPGSVGRPVMGSIHICDDDGHELPVGEIGTIYFSGAYNFSYHNDPEKTAASRNPLNPDWSTMGDVGRLDDEGFLYLSDRKDFMIISGGVNIYPQEVENLLITHPAVEDVAVIGVPNPDFGEEVKAVVQAKSSAQPGDALASELIEWCRERLADVKCPRSIDFDPALPRTDTGKLMKKEVKARYWPAE
ncbi:acyl-CoA synthetase [Novosphingobium pentaromativorans]|uniref:AMP-dependent synthetase and ligase n=1 Tax=Novosphingobium pentaromativorans US6-1 TaxID=1088721 RepID=G6EDB8_9SPHN|nr:acyl-CoA synthetase [Novosphingobium pentaromativorans]AIT79797.1 acyl-CoA synthetase [Novosphingobium pentaromativorans US6-1]EHJ60717.1 AMP-dependent synthetase and ligase [Novosphingobium pentaromativorans US6-1]